MAIPDGHPLSIADTGLTGLMMGLSQADVVIAAGIRFNWSLQFGELFPDAKVVRIDIDPHEIDRNRRSDVGLVGDMGTTLAELVQLVEKGEHQGWINDLRGAARSFMVSEFEQREKPSHPIHPARLVARIQEAVGKDALYVVDGGDTTYFGLVGFQSSQKAGVVASAGGLFGCLGTGIPYGIAAKLARPEREVVG
ncbi:MAG: hypothetical protein DRH12_09000 [Deltaproteobacteria bacterium]|nr:MAG: hypothetical protein DRH12_09000 [Deltaproteobacteria bacterium]